MGMGAPEMEDEKNSKLKYLVIILAVTAIFTTGCAKKEMPKPKEIEKQEPGVDATTDAVQQKVLSFNLEGLGEKGAKKWDVQGESAEAISENEIKLNNIVAKTYGDEALATITADKGIYDKSKNNVRLEENVKATVENAQSFAKDYATFPGQIAGQAAKEVENDPNDQKKTKTVITCDGEVLFDYENNFAYFDKNVKVFSDDGNIDADKITVNLEPATKKIKDIVAEGNVRITRGENATYSEKATYIESDKKIVLTGKPKLVIYQEGSVENKFLGQ